MQFEFFVHAESKWGTSMRAHVSVVEMKFSLLATLWPTVFESVKMALVISSLSGLPMHCSMIALPDRLETRLVEWNQVSMFSLKRAIFY